MSVTTDHGKGHSRFARDFMTPTKLESGEWTEDERVCTKGNARCKKDSAEIIRNAFGTSLNDHMKITANWKFVSIVEGQATSGGHEVAPKMKQIELLMAGDTLLCSVAIGKEGFSTWWHCLRKLLKKDWQQAGHERGEPWKST